ncbi:17286_t:CDS:2 [Acaulospora colombiana]|uniref:17286_t:CDS:1 n=1 Tax=Acaulospora colombiana TaxID=27376 RepID=A0ACA9K1E1_9GLOM|nr:17286_t:CDS:2 [Acaulospora colombiana]
MISKAIILVGGPSRGTRFRPLSLDSPKPLFPVAGHPIIWHHLEAVSKVEDLKEVLLIGFFENSVFERFIEDASRDFPNIIVRQDQLQDGKLRLEQDLLGSLVDTRKLYVYETTDFWRQIKTAASAIPANAFYLEQYRKNNPDLLLKNESNGPEIVGCVYKHPTAIIDPSAKVCESHLRQSFRVA